LAQLCIVQPTGYPTAMIGLKTAPSQTKRKQHGKLSSAAFHIEQNSRPITMVHLTNAREL